MTHLRVSLVCIPLIVACGGRGAAPAADPTDARSGEAGPELEADASGARGARDAEGGGYVASRDGSGVHDEARYAGARAPSAPRSAALEAEDAAGALLPRQERPGLATHWGEMRRSPTRTVSFVRQHPSSPLDVVTFSYDDEAGVAALTGRYPGEARSMRQLAGGALTVTIEDATGRPLPAVGFDGRLVAAGEPGARYQIRVDNHSPRRFEIVATVDGLDVIDGGDGDLQKRGYLVGAWDTIEIDGFRRSEDEVAAFRFGDVSGSYAEASGRGRDIGVIGVAAFGERGDVVEQRRDDWRDLEMRRSAEPFPRRFAEPPRSLVR